MRQVSSETRAVEATFTQTTPPVRCHDRYLEEIKDHLGHASIRTTSDRYGHLYQAARDRLRDHLDQTFQTVDAGSE